MPPEAAASLPTASIVEPPIEPALATTDTLTIDEALPIAGAAGLGLLALAGAGFAMRRRRRRSDEALAEAKRRQIDAASLEPAMESTPAPAFEPAPTFVRAQRPDVVPVTPVAGATAVAASDVPSEFDLSRFGPHVQAAYRGPTSDNPSASLKRRLTVGHFLDKQSAKAPHSPAPDKPADGPQPAWAARKHDDFMLRRSDTKPAMRPAYQK